MAATAVTLNDLEGHSPVAGLFKCNLSNICAAFYTISTDNVLTRFLCISRACCIPWTLSLPNVCCWGYWRICLFSVLFYNLALRKCERLCTSGHCLPIVTNSNSCICSAPPTVSPVAHSKKAHLCLKLVKLISFVSEQWMLLRRQTSKQLSRNCHRMIMGWW